jgi:hypothetical protein
MPAVLLKLVSNLQNFTGDFQPRDRYSWARNDEYNLHRVRTGNPILEQTLIRTGLGSGVCLKLRALGRC